MHRRDFLKTASPGAMAGTMPGLHVPAAGTGPAASRSAPATGIALVSDALYLDHVLIRPNGSRPPEVPERLVRIRSELAARGLIEATVPLSPTADPLDRIRAHHTGERVDSVRQLGVTTRVAELAVSRALTAVDAVADGTVRNALARFARPATMRTTPAPRKASATTPTPRSRPNARRTCTGTKRSSSSTGTTPS